MEKTSSFHRIDPDFLPVYFLRKPVKGVNERTDRKHHQLTDFAETPCIIEKQKPAPIPDTAFSYNTLLSLAHINMSAP